MPVCRGLCQWLGSPVWRSRCCRQFSIFFALDQFFAINMLPRHLLARTSQFRSSISLRPTNINIIASRAQRSSRSITPLAITSTSVRAIHSSSSRKQNELPKSPFQTFVDVLKEELQKNRELQEGVKTLQGDVDKLQDSEALKRARDMYERARVRKFLCKYNYKRYLIKANGLMT